MNNCEWLMINEKTRFFSINKSIVFRAFLKLK